MFLGKDASLFLSLKRLYSFLIFSSSSLKYFFLGDLTLPLVSSQTSPHLFRLIDSSPFDPVSLSSLSVLLGCVVVYSPWCPTFFHFFFISFFHPLVALLRCTVGECRSGRQTDTGRVL